MWLFFCLTACAALDFEAITYFKSFNELTDDELFGWCVALSGDGKTLAVAAPRDANYYGGINPSRSYPYSLRKTVSGAVWIFRQQMNMSWALDAFVKASNPDAGDNFGSMFDEFLVTLHDGPRCSLALSFDGARLAVGAPGEDSGANGIDGNQTWNNVTNSGAVYIFSRANGSWKQDAYIKPSIVGPNYLFGAAVALNSDGSMLAVGAPGEASDGFGFFGNQSDDRRLNAGAAYVFAITDNTWAQRHYIKPPVSWSLLPLNVTTFGRSISVSGDGLRMAIGSDTAVLVLFWNNVTSEWEQQPLPPVPVGWCDEDSFDGCNYGLNYGFGMAVVLSRDASTLAVGSPTVYAAQSVGGFLYMTGAVYVFRNSSGGWRLERSIFPSRLDVSYKFGTNVWLSENGSILCVSAPFDSSSASLLNGDENSDALSQSGATFLYARSEAGLWMKSLYLKAPNAGLQARFGFVVGSDDASLLAIGSPYESGDARGINGNQTWRKMAVTDSRPWWLAVGMDGAAYTYQVSLCPAGFSGTLRSGCVDVDECLVNNGDCDPLTVCVNTIGSRICGSCPVGYTPGTGETPCMDVNECALNNGGCDVLTTCSNLVGSFECGSCPLGSNGNATFGCFVTTTGFGSLLGDAISVLTEHVVIVGNTSVPSTEHLTANFSLFIKTGHLNISGIVTFGPKSFTRVDGNFILSGTIYFHVGAIVDVGGSLEVLPSASLFLVLDSDPGNVESVNSSVIHLSGIVSETRAQRRNVQRDEAGSSFPNSDCYVLSLTSSFVTSKSLSLSRSVSNSCFSGTCLVNNGGCDLLTSCFQRTAEMHTCGSCPPGYTGTGETSCQDVDECALSNGGCDNLTLCTNTPGSRECGPCPIGYDGSGLVGCTDINECALSNGGCDPLTLCTNLPGSFQCGTCPSGYSGTGIAGCVDVDECISGNGGCDVLTNCTNTIGSFVCSSCPPGYTGSGVSGCVDINECESQNGGCDPLVNCTNTPGSRECGSCPNGYTGTGLSGCVDINECEKNNGGCVRLCVNLPGSFQCSPCPAGFKGSSLPGCFDVDECASHNGGCPEDCRNTIGSFSCSSCRPGYAGVGCQDIDECAINNGGCAQLCVNVPGSFACQACGTGFEWNGSSCVDVNECLTNNGGCDVMRNCSNFAGSFVCGACPTGFESQSEISPCVDIDECLVNNGGCDPLTQCTNSPGSYSCGPCPAGYYPGTGKTPCIRVQSCYSGQVPFLAAKSIPSYVLPAQSLVGGNGSMPIYGLSFAFESLNIYFSNGTLRSHGFLPHGKQLNFTVALALDAERNFLYVLFSTPRSELCRVNVPDWTSSMCFPISGSIGTADMTLDSSGQLVFVLGGSNPYLASNGVIQVVNTTSGLVSLRGTNTSLSGVKKIEYDYLRARLLVLDGNGLQVVDSLSLQRLMSFGNAVFSPFDFAFASSSNLVFYARFNLVHVVYGTNHSYWTSFGGSGFSSTIGCIWISQENSTHVFVSVTSNVASNYPYDEHLIRTWMFEVRTGVAVLFEIRGPRAKVELPRCSGAIDMFSGSLWCSIVGGGSFHEWDINGDEVSLLREFGVAKLSSITLSPINFLVIDNIYGLGVSNSRIVIAAKSSLVVDKANPNAVIASSLSGRTVFAVKVWTEPSGKETATMMTASSIDRFDVSTPLTYVSRSIFAWPNGTEVSIRFSAMFAALDIRTEGNSTFMYASSDGYGLFKFQYEMSSSRVTIVSRWRSACVTSLAAPPLPNTFVWVTDLCQKTVSIISDNGQQGQSATGMMITAWSGDSSFSPRLLCTNSSVLVLQQGIIQLFAPNGTLLGTRGKRYGSMRRAVLSGQLEVGSVLSSAGPNFVMSVGHDALYVASDTGRVDKLSKMDLKPLGSSYLADFSSSRPGRVQDGVVFAGSVVASNGMQERNNLLARVNLTTMQTIDVLGNSSFFFGMTSSSNSISVFGSASSTNGCLWLFVQNSSSYFRVYRLAANLSTSLGYASILSAYLPILDAKEDPKGKTLYVLTNANVILKIDVVNFATTSFVPYVNQRAFSAKTIDFDSIGNMVIGASRDLFGVLILDPNGAQLAFYDLSNSFTRLSYMRVDTFSYPSYSGIAIYAAYQFPAIFKYELVCSCGAGYAGINCSDIDECAVRTAKCSYLASCVNTIGSYTCVCNPGFAGDGFNCTAVDECALGTHNCDVNAICRKVYGASFTCTCRDGFTGPGTSCQDIDECQLGQHNCTAHSFCINTIGGYSCSCALSNFTGRACLATTGHGCENADDCFSGFCSDGICCNKPCVSNITACSAARKGHGVDGICDCIGYGTCDDEMFSWSQRAIVSGMSSPKWSRPYYGVGGGSNPVFFRTFGLETINIGFPNGSFVAHGVLPNGQQANITNQFAFDRVRQKLYVVPNTGNTRTFCEIDVPHWTSGECFSIDWFGQYDLAIDPATQLLYALGCTRTTSCVQVIDVKSRSMVNWASNVSFTLESGSSFALDGISKRLFIVAKDSIAVLNASSLMILPESPWNYTYDSFFTRPSKIAFAETSQLLFVSSSLVHVYFANQTYFTSFDAAGAGLWISEENGTHVFLSGIQSYENMIGSSDGLVKTWSFEVVSGKASLFSSIGQRAIGRKLPKLSGKYKPKSLQSWWSVGDGASVIQEYDLSSGNVQLASEYGRAYYPTAPPSWLSKTNLPLNFVGAPLGIDVGDSAVAVVGNSNGLVLNKTNPNVVLSLLDFSVTFVGVRIWTGNDGLEKVIVLSNWDIYQFPVNNPSFRLRRSDARWKDGSLLRWYSPAHVYVRAENGLHFIYLVDQLGVMKLPYDIAQEPFTVVRRWFWPSQSFYGDILVPDLPGYPVFFWISGEKTLYRLLDNGAESQGMPFVSFVTVRDSNLGSYITDAFCIDSIIYVRVGPLLHKYNANGTYLGTLGQDHPTTYIFDRSQLDEIGDSPPVVTKDFVFVKNGASIAQFQKSDLSHVRTITAPGNWRSLHYTGGLLLLGSSIVHVTTGRTISSLGSNTFCGIEGQWEFLESTFGLDGSVWIAAQLMAKSNSSASASMSLSGCSTTFHVFHLDSDFSACLGFLEFRPGQWVKAVRIDPMGEFIYVALGWQFGCSGDQEVRKYRIADHTLEAIIPVRFTSGKIGQKKNEQNFFRK